FVGVELGKKIFKGLANAEEADVGQRRCGQIAAQNITSLGSDRRSIGALSPAFKPFVLLGFPIAQRLPRLRVSELNLFDRKRSLDKLDHRLDLARVGFKEKVH